jgi:hypothetical protein
MTAKPLDYAGECPLYRKRSVGYRLDTAKTWLDSAKVRAEGWDEMADRIQAVIAQVDEIHADVRKATGDEASVRTKELKQSEA